LLFFMAHTLAVQESPPRYGASIFASIFAGDRAGSGALDQARWIRRAGSGALD
jgi:hypothetical protein